MHRQKATELIQGRKDPGYGTGLKAKSVALKQRRLREAEEQMESSRK